MAQTKLAGAWSYEDILTLPNDGRRYEVIEGHLYEMPSPSSVHAATIINLIALLLPMVAALRGRLFTAPLDVFIPGGTQFNQMFLSYFQTVKHEWKCAASKALPTS